MQADKENQAGSRGEPPPAQTEAPSSSAPGKKTTRRWAAWTHEEEANFFIALRQVGKNFDKITSRVQSKDKEQVRHYYYRIIKRMNKLLGPAFVLDAKNTKDANAALLRWWSLLEKYSCSASKLHLKPRRFKTFVSALAHALLKDRKKTKKKQSVEDNATPIATGLSTVGPGKSILSDSESAKMVPTEVQSIQKLGTAKGTTVKRHGGQCANRSKGEASKTKPCQRRRKASDNPVSSAAYKKWEKAANAGVTLVAEAAEQLERAALADQIPPDHEVLYGHSMQNVIPSGSECICLPKRRNGQSQANAVKTSSQLSSKIFVSKEPRSTVVERRLGDAAIQSLVAPMPNQTTFQGEIAQTFLQPGQNFDPFKTSAECYNYGLCGRADNSVKLKLQLFPIDDFTRKSLEKDGHNPHLELTLKARKMISSVLQHLTQKWGRSAIASGELLLFPYHAQSKDFRNCQSWSMKDSTACAGDVYAALGSPTIFRLRYGWVGPCVLQIPNAETCPASGISKIDIPEKIVQSEIYRTVKVRRLDDNGGAMPSLANKENMSRSLCSDYCLKEIQNGNLSKARESYIDYGQSITLPLGSVQSTTHMSTVTSVKDLSVPIRQPESFSYEVKENGDGKSGHSNKVIPKPVEGIADKSMDNDNNNKRFPQPNFSSISEQPVHDAVTENVCDVPESPSRIHGSSWLDGEKNGGFVQRLSENEETLKSNNQSVLSTMDWVDGLSNISVGDLLNESSCAAHGNSFDGLSVSSGMQSQLFPQYMDSFDAAINAHIARFQEVPYMSINHSQPSIWDGEETRDAFAFQKNPFSVQELGPIKTTILRSSSQERFALGNTTLEELPSVGDLKVDSFAREQSQDANVAKESTVNDLYWADSLGSLDISIRPSGVQGADLLGGDNSISFSGLVAISLDAFQNCSIFGSEKKVLSHINGQDQQATSAFPAIESGNDCLFVFDSKNMEKRKSASLDTNHEFATAVVELHGAQKQLTLSADGVPV